MPKDKTETRALIIRSMTEEFLSRGYKRASLNSISARVGISTAGLYRHFRSKEDMFRFLVQSTLDDIEKLASEHAEQEQALAFYKPFDTNWAAFWVDFIFAHWEGMKLLVCYSAGSSYESFEEDLVQLEAQGNKQYKNALRKTGRTIRRISDEQWQMLATAYVHLVLEIVRRDMTRKKALAHMQFVSELLYPGWRALFT